MKNNVSVHEGMKNNVSVCEKFKMLKGCSSL